MAFEDHCRWIRSLRESYDSIRASEQDSQRYQDSLGEDSGGPGVGIGHDGETGRVARLLAERFDQPITAEQLAYGLDRALDIQDFDEPVYRGLDLIGSEHSQQDFEVGHDCYDFEEPVYRGLGSYITGTDSDSVDSPHDSEWLATMPPLVHRQSARMW